MKYELLSDKCTEFFYLFVCRMGRSTAIDTIIAVDVGLELLSFINLSIYLIPP